MIETRSDAPALPAVPENAEEPAGPRGPFVQPAVEELGRLTELTLLGGSSP